MRYAKQPTPPRSPKDNDTWLDTDNGKKWRFRAGKGWVKFRASTKHRPDWTAKEDRVLRDLYPIGGAEAVHDALPRRAILPIKQRAHKLAVKGPLPPRGLRTMLSGDNLASMFAAAIGQRLTYKELIA